MRFAEVLLACSLVAASVHGADFFLTQDGAGQGNGSTWSNAFNKDSLSRAVNEVLRPGDRLLIAGGEYTNVTLVVSKGGSDGAPKTLMGVDRGNGFPVFRGNWTIDRPSKGATALVLAPGVGHIVLKNLRINGYAFGIHAPPVDGASPRQHIEFEDVDIRCFRYGFYLADCHDLRLSGCDLKRYSKHGFRFDQGCSSVVITNCTADCSEGDPEWEKLTETFPFGFIVNDSGRDQDDIRFEECLSQNNLMPAQTNRYKNGDGFVVETNSSNVSFLRCRSIRNQDGGFDLKVSKVVLKDCVALRNFRNYRIWSGGYLTNCFSGWAKLGLWSKGGGVIVERSTFHSLLDKAVQTDDRATDPVLLSRCLISETGEVWGNTSRGKVTVENSVVLKSGSAADSPGYLNPDVSWDGKGEAMNSQTYGTHGYRGR